MSAGALPSPPMPRPHPSGKEIATIDELSASYGRRLIREELERQRAAELADGERRRLEEERRARYGDTPARPHRHHAHARKVAQTRGVLQ